MEDQEANPQNPTGAPDQTQTTQDTIQTEIPPREPSTQQSDHPQPDSSISQPEPQANSNQENPAVAAVPETNATQNQPEPDTIVVDPKAPKIYAYGSCECDQFLIGEDRYETKRPIELTNYFASLSRTVFSVTCGGLHSLILLTNGDVYSVGCNDDGALGRAGDENRPLKVDLPVPVDMISAGDSHSVACNSANSMVFQWGVYRNILGGNLSKVDVPHRIGEKEFGRKKVKKIASGANHTLVLIEGKVYVWGDPEACILGRLPTEKRRFAQGLSIEGLGVRGVEDIFAGNSHSFAIRKYKKRGEGERTSVLSWGLNNFGQLGIGHFENTATPTEIPEFEGKEIKNITGGEHHTIVLTTNGEIYGFGKNDEGQLGLGEDFQFEDEEEEKEEEKGEADKEGKMEEEKPKKEERSTQRIPNPIKIKVDNIEKIFSGSNYNYAVGKNKDVYSWGMGENYVLGTREDETVYEPQKVSADFFKGTAYTFGLGAQHVVYLTSENESEAPKLEEDVFTVIQTGKKPVAKKTEKKGKNAIEEEKADKKEEKEEEEEKKEKKVTRSRGRSKAKKVEPKAEKGKKGASKSASKPEPKKETTGKKAVGKRKAAPEVKKETKKVKVAEKETRSKSQQGKRGKSAKRK